MKSLLGAFVDDVSSGMGTWGEVSDKLDQGSEQGTLIEGMVVSELNTQGLILKTAGLLFGTSSLILLVLSIMLILQGLANQAKK